MTRIGLVVHPHRALDGPLATLRAWAAATGDEVVQVLIPGQDRVVAPAGEITSCDLVAALGGDGTTLAALHAAARTGTPVLGIACGSLGALTATSAARLDDALRAFATGAWRPRRLPGIAIAADGADCGVAVNDLVIVRRGASQVAIDIRVDGQLYGRFAGDGIVVATPLGSSAYTMAAGGPIIAPGSEAIVLTPLAPHGGACPPLVVGTGSAIDIEVEPGHGGARMEFDGQVKDVQPRSLAIGWVPEHATLVSIEDDEPLFAGLRRRRILMDSPRIIARDERAAAVAAADGPPAP